MGFNRRRLEADRKAKADSALPAEHAFCIAASAKTAVHGRG